MIYVGSGRIGILLSQSDMSENSNYDILWGRRALKIRPSNLKSVFRRKVIYLDTVDVWHNKARGKLWLWWALSPYRIEKFLTYVMLVILCKHVVRLHVPAISDSVAWERLIVDDDRESITAPGFTYDSIMEFVKYVDSRDGSVRTYTSIEMFEIAKSHKMTIQFVNADPDVNASKLLGGML